MYNGVGLPTPRGSGTSGHIQKNLGYVPARRSDIKPDATRKRASALADLKGDPELLEHERRRRVEIKLLDLIDELEDAGLNPDEIDEKVEAERQKLLATERLDPSAKDERDETHLQAYRKAEEDAKLRKAFGIPPAKAPKLEDSPSADKRALQDEPETRALRDELNDP